LKRLIVDAARTLRSRRRRAWSQRAAGAPFVALAKRILAAQVAARSPELPLAWEEAAAALEHEHEHWRLVEPEPIDDLLGELAD
jgi:hypothetical protein